MDLPLYFLLYAYYNIGSVAAIMTTLFFMNCYFRLNSYSIVYNSIYTDNLILLYCSVTL